MSNHQIALFGAGRIGNVHARNVVDHVSTTLKYLVDPIEAPARKLAAPRLVPIRQEHRVERLVRLDAHSVLGHDVGPVEKVRDAAEAHRSHCVQ